MILFNMLLTCICFWIILVVNYRYLQPARRNRSRFKLYRLRDELSLLAMRGELDERSAEYRTLLKILNGALRALGTFQVTDYARYLLALKQNPALQSRIEGIVDNLSRTDNKEYCRIAFNTFSIMHEMLVTDTRTLRYVIYPLLNPLVSFLSLLHVTKPEQAVQRKQLIVKEIDADIANRKNAFGSYCAAH